MKRIVVAVVLAVASSMAFAGWHVHQPTRFIVSGVLKKDGTTDTIRPIHAIVVAETGDTAVQQFSQTARRDYPGYSLIATLASPVPEAGRCESSI
jgi:hypothetical protein